MQRRIPVFAAVTSSRPKATFSPRWFRLSLRRNAARLRRTDRGDTALHDRARRRRREAFRVHVVIHQRRCSAPKPPKRRFRRRRRRITSPESRRRADIRPEPATIPNDAHSRSRCPTPRCRPRHRCRCRRRRPARCRSGASAKRLRMMLALHDCEASALVEVDGDAHRRAVHGVSAITAPSNENPMQRHLADLADAVSRDLDVGRRIAAHRGVIRSCGCGFPHNHIAGAKCVHGVAVLSEPPGPALMSSMRLREPACRRRRWPCAGSRCRCRWCRMVLREREALRVRRRWPSWPCW